MSFNVPSKVADRLQTGIKKFQTILASAKSRDCNESDTSTIVSDMLAEIFGYDKYSEITSELAIRGTYCDLAIKLDGKLVLLIEIKAIGLELKEAHTKQAIDYAANQGVEWVILTNGIYWHIYHIIFSQPIEQELVYNFNFLDLNHKTDDDVESIYLLTKEGQSKFALEDFHSQRQVMNRFFISAILDSEAVLSVLRRIAPDVKMEIEEIATIITNEIIKREILESEKFKDAQRHIRRVQTKMLKEREKKNDEKCDLTEHPLPENVSTPQ